MLYMYDPIMAIKTPTTYEDLSKITGKSIANLRGYKSKMQLIRSIKCYLIADDEVDRKTLRNLRENFKIKDEIWKVCDIGGMISNYGRYRGEDGKLRLPFLKYKRRRLVYKINCKECTIHSLVASNFLENPKKLPNVIHKDLDYKNCHANNLEYVDNKKAGFLNSKLIPRIPVLKIDPSTFEIVDEYSGIKEAARINFIVPQGITSVIKGRQKTAAGFIWKIDYEMMKLMS